MNWWHNGFGQKKFRAGTGIRSQLNDELFNCTSTKEDLGTDTPSKTDPVEVKGSVVVTEYKPIPDLEYLQVKNLIEKPQFDHLPLIEASRLCNMDIISKVQQVICLAFHDSKLIMETCPVEMVPLYQIDYFDS